MRSSIFQVDNDFAFNYKMLDPKTLQALAKVLPPTDGTLEYPPQRLRTWS